MEGDQQIRTMARDLARLQAQASAAPVKTPVLDIAKNPAPAPAPQPPPAPKPQIPPPPPLQPKPTPPAPPGSATPQRMPLPPKPTPPTAEKRPSLAEILSQARTRAVGMPRPSEAYGEGGPRPSQELRPSTPVRDAEPSPTQKAIEDILPIEESRPDATAKPRLNAAKAKGIEPPDNLPTGEKISALPSSARAPSPPFELPLKSVPPGPLLETKPTPPRPPQTPAPGVPKTPEEILGLSVKPGPLKQSEVSPRPIPHTPQPFIKEDKRELEELQQKQPHRNIPTRKFALLIGGLVAVSIFVFGVLLWKVLIQEPPMPPPPPIGPVEQPLPEALILYDKLETIEISNLNYDSLKPKLDALLASDLPPGSLAYIPVQLTNLQEIRYLALAELINALQIDAPPALLDYKEYTLFLYAQKTEAKTVCAENGVQSELCYGPRLGLVVKTLEGQSKMFNVMKEWEKTLAKDLKPLLLFAPQIPQNQTFQVGKHKDLDTHYLNMPVDTMSIDWIANTNHLILSTSKDAARAAIDNLLLPASEEAGNVR